MLQPDTGVGVRLEMVEMPNRRILVVDDEAAIREVVVSCLQKLGGWEVSTAVSGQEALRLVHTLRVDAIVLNGMIPEMDGFAFLQRLRSHPSTQLIPVILLTGSRDFPDAHLFSSLGVISTIAKPFRPVDLVRQIADAMGW